MTSSEVEGSTAGASRDRDLEWPDWLEGLPAREKLQAIMAAVHRCYMECGPNAVEPTGPHMTVSMAEIFLSQILEK